jgi:hypothetical protein
VLIVPYARLWPATAGDQRMALTVYIATLVVSAVIAVWFLLFNPIWKFGRGQGTPVRDWRKRRATTEDGIPVVMETSVTSL